MVGLLELSGYETSTWYDAAASRRHGKVEPRILKSFRIIYWKRIGPRCGFVRGDGVHQFPKIELLRCQEDWSVLPLDLWDLAAIIIFNWDPHLFEIEATLAGFWHPMLIPSEAERVQAFLFFVRIWGEQVFGMIWESQNVIVMLLIPLIRVIKAPNWGFLG
jgi:hypothetical protein